MAIMFHNVKTGERRLCKTEPMIAAHLNTSDRNPNAHQGQDMGWRISPDTLIKLEQYMSDEFMIERIAAKFGKPVDAVSESDVLNFISRENQSKGGEKKISRKDFEREYENDIRRLREEQDKRDQAIAREARSKGEDVPQRILEQERAQASQPSAPESANIEEGLTPPVDLESLSRPQLEEYADGVGVENPKEFANKPELIKAIKAKEE